MEDKTIKIGAKLYDGAKYLARKNRRTIKTTIELAIESAMKAEKEKQ